MCHDISFGELQLTKISLSFKTSYCNLKSRDLGAKLCVAFLLSSFWKELWRFKFKESMHFVGCYAVSYFNYAGSSWCFLINQKLKKNYTSILLTWNSSVTKTWSLSSNHSILKLFYVEETSNRIGLENFGTKA